MDFNVFYCNLVNILIHFFFPITGLLDESYLVGDWEGRGTGIHHLSPWQYSSVTVSTWWPTQLGNSPPDTLGYCFSHKDQDMQVELWQNRELTSWWDSLWKRGADRLIRTYLASVIFSPACEFLSLSLVFQHPHLLPGVVMEPKAPVAHLCAVLLFRTVMAGKQMKTYTAEAGTYVLMLLGKEVHQEMKCKRYCWLLKYTQVVSWLWQERSLQSEALAVTSTVSLLVLFSGVR